MRLAYGVLLAGFALSLVPQAADASSCVKPVTQKIVFAKGAACWTYSGKATHFTGRFSAGQKLTIKMSGELLEYNEQDKSHWRRSGRHAFRASTARRISTPKAISIRTPARSK